MAVPTNAQDIRKSAVTNTASLMLRRHLAGKDSDVGAAFESHRQSLIGCAKGWDAYADTLYERDIETIIGYLDDAQAIFDKTVGKRKPEIAVFWAKSAKQKKAAAKDRKAKAKAKIAQSA